MMQLKKIKGPLFLFITAFLWGTTFVAQSVSAKSIEPFTFNGIRMIIGGVCLIPVVLIRGKGKIKNLFPTKESKKHTFQGGIVCGIILCAASYTQQMGLTLGTSAGKSGFISAMYVIFVPIVSVIFLKKKVSPYIWAAVVAAVFGLYFLCMGDFSAGVSEALRNLNFSAGDLITLVSAGLYTCHIIAVDKYTPDTDGVLISSLQFIFAGIISIIFMFIFENPQISNILDAKWGILYAAVFSSGIAYTLQILGQKTTPPPLASLIMCMESVFAVISDTVILKTSMKAEEILGFVLMLTAIITANMSQFTKTKGIKIKK